MKLLILYVLLFTSLLHGYNSKAQVVISVRDSLSGESLPGAFILVDETLYTTNADGQISLFPLNDTTAIEGIMLGYESKKTRFGALKQNQFTLLLNVAYEDIEDIIVVGRRNLTSQDLIGKVDVIDARQISLLQSNNSADVLEQSGNVYVQKSQLGGGSPILRGFEANKVLLVVDGIRLNNAIYRNGHLQNAITVDNQVLQQVEIVHGPGSLIYGSDALGGVIHFKTKEPQLGNSYGQAMVRYGTAAREKRVHSLINVGLEKWSTLLSFSHVDFGHLKAGENGNNKYPSWGIRPYYVKRINGVDSVIQNKSVYKQQPSSYNQTDLLAKLRHKRSNNTEYTFNVQYSTSSDVPRYDILTDTLAGADQLEYAEWFYGPQNRLLLGFRTDLKNTGWFDRSSIIISYQHLDEDRFNRLFDSEWRSAQLVQVGVLGLSVDFENRWLSDHLICWYGLDFQHNKVSSTAFEENIINGNINEDLITRYPGENNFTLTSAAYAKLKWQKKTSPFIVQGGARLSSHHLESVFNSNGLVQWPESYFEGIKADNLALTGSISLKIKPGKNWGLETALTSGFHFPNIDDFAKVRVRSSWVSVPNPDLQPERSYNAEFSAGKKWIGENFYFKASASLFFTHLTNIIIRDEFVLPNGDSTLVIEGRARVVQANVNAEQGRIIGFFAGVESRVGKHLLADAKINFTRGRTLKNDNNEPLAHIPPIYGKVAITYKEAKFQSSVALWFNGKKPINRFAPGSSDNADRATPEGSPGWVTLNFYSAFQIFHSVFAEIALENITDLHYRTFSSGISAPGRNFSFTLRKSF